MSRVKDTVCGRDLDTDLIDTPVGQTRFGAAEVDPAMGTKRFHEGAWYYFCSLACRGKFGSNPSLYLQGDQIGRDG